MGFLSGRNGRRDGIGAKAAALAASALLLALVAIAAAALSSSPGDRATAVAAAPLAATDTLTIANPVDRTCFKRELEGASGAVSVTVAGPDLAGASFGTVEARLAGPAGGDWDLSVFDESGKVVGASTSSGADEIASGYVVEPGELIVQACRISGQGTVAELTVETAAVEHSEVEKVSLALVQTPSRSDKDALGSLGLDPAEGAGRDWVKVVLYGSDDRAQLERAGLDYEIEVANLGRQSARDRIAERTYARQAPRSSLPSGRDTYRRLFDYTQELKDLAAANPAITRPITLGHETYEGRPVEGIEITTDPNNLNDGKPVFLQTGVHHAREWPSSESAMEWAYELINGYNAGDARVRRLVEDTRTIVIPIVNPDGFNASREAGQSQGAANGRPGNDIVNFAMSPNEYRRKNCRFADDSEGGSCTQPSVGLAELGVDPNRNYGGFWAGPGASGDSTSQTYYGPGPFSEPETQNIRELVSTRQVTTLITNHTFSNLILRPPGLASEPVSVDESVYKALGDAMAAENGYLSLAGFQLYDTSGTTEDWSYNATGGLGFTYEIGCNRADPENPDPENQDCIGNFHPPFEEVIAQYEGTTPEAEAVGGGGNREAYFIAQESTANPERHSVLEGEAPAGAILKVEKTFQTPTKAEDPASFEDHLESAMQVPSSGRFEFHINPSTRPLVALAKGRLADGPPSGEIAFAGGTPGSSIPCGDAASTMATCIEETPFEIVNSPGTDNDAATVAIEWPSPASDWDMFVYRDGNGDGDSLDPEDTEVGQSAQGGTDQESTTFIRPEAPGGKLEPGKYVVRVVNFAAAEPYTGTISFEGPEEFVPAMTETWKLTCSVGGQVVGSQDLLIARGERKQVDLCGPAVTPGGTPPPGGDGAGVGACSNLIDGTGKGDKLRGTDGDDRIVGRKGNDRIDGGAGNDCLLGKGDRDKLNGNGGGDDIRGGNGKDKIKGNGGGDVIRTGRSKDTVAAGGGSDTVRAARGGRDTIDCGPGEDTAIINKRKDSTRRCEKVKLR